MYFPVQSISKRASAPSNGVTEAPFLPEADITSIICSGSHCTMALSGGVDLSQSSSTAMMFFATWDGVSFPLLQDRRRWDRVTRPPTPHPNTRFVSHGAVKL